MNAMLIQTRFNGEIDEVGITAYLDSLPTDKDLTMFIKIDDAIQFVNRDLSEPTKSTMANFKGLEINKPYDVEFAIIENGITETKTIPMYAQKCNYPQAPSFCNFSGGKFVSKSSRMKGGDLYGDG